MRRMLTAASLSALVCGVVLADTVTIAGTDTFVTMPSNATFKANTPTGNTPYWNNVSLDAPAGSPFNAATQGYNAGYVLTNTGVFSAGTLSPAPDKYLGNTGNNNVAPGAFSFLRAMTSIQVTIIYQNAGANSGSFGTVVGIYDVNSPSTKIPIYASGTIPANVGVVKNVDTSGISGAGAYGFYATSCTTSGGACFTFFTNPGLNPNVVNFGTTTPVVEGSSNVHQHFALFTLIGQPLNFYLGYEDSINGNLGFVGTGGFEKYGDFNDVIIRITTGDVPEPGTFAFLGLGLVALGWRARKLRK